jgi:hypothetical protein
MRMRYKLPMYLFLFLSPILVPLVLIPWAERVIVLVTGDKLDQASHRLAGPNALILVPFAGRSIVWVTGDRLDWATWRLASNATNCGRVRFDDPDARQASKCVLSVVRERRPFRVRYDMIGIDARPSISLVGAPDGRVYELSSSTSANVVAIFGESVSTRLCDEPVAFESLGELFRRSRGVISCARGFLFPPR